MAVNLRGPTLRVSSSLKDLSLTDDSRPVDESGQPVQLLSIQGEEVASFSYETYDTSDGQHDVNSAVMFHAGSLRAEFAEKPLHEMFTFAMRLAHLKGLYDAATIAAAAAAERVTAIQKMKLDIAIQSPVIAFPRDSPQSRDILLVKLGEIGARNTYVGNENRMKATLTGIRVTSTIYNNGVPAELKMLEDVDISTDIIQTLGIDRSQNVQLPDNRVRGTFLVRVVLSFLHRYLLNRRISSCP